MKAGFGLAGALLAAACARGGALEPAARGVAPVVEEARTWRPAEARDLTGLFESRAIEGEAAGALWKVYYHFAVNGSYTGAALVIGGAQPEFQTLAGRWTLADGVLDLGQGERLAARVAGDELELESPGGRARLVRVALQ
jgi:hypothetical protein